METKEKFFSCPYCGQTISAVLDLSVNGQIYIEDCEVCCHPLEIRYSVRNGNVAEFSVCRTQ
ncbi:MAG: CPXCG motif-containing cysteine-rich protein [Nitrospinaceae bacterium]